MAYQNPAFIVRHYGSEVGVASISSSVAAATGFGKERLIDYRLTNSFKFSTSAAAHWIEYDLGSLSGVAVNRLIIPAGHNLGGVTLTVKSGASTPPATSRGSAAATTGALFDLILTSSTDRYWRLEFGSTGQWELPEMWLGQVQQTSTGPRPGWQLPLYTPATVRSFATREAVLVAGTPRRRLVMEHQALSGADLGIYAALLSRGVRAPFWFYPPDDDTSIFSPRPLLLRLSDDGEMEQDHPIPQNARSYTVKLRALEQTT